GARLLERQFGMAVQVDEQRFEIDRHAASLSPGCPGLACRRPSRRPSAGGEDGGSRDAGGERRGNPPADVRRLCLDERVQKTPEARTAGTGALLWLAVATFSMGIDGY